MTFSLAAVVIAVALGWYAFSPWVGVGAGALKAVEYELILWGVRGWRDEAFLAIVPLWALAMLRAARAPAIASGAGLVAAVVAGPYPFNCWREFGDPLYAVTYHTAYYETAGTGPAPASSVSGFVTSAALARPFGTIAPARQGAVTMRTSVGVPSTIRLPLQRPGAFDLRLRVDPFPPPAAPGATGSTLLVFANGRPVGRVALAWDPERVGWYELRLPREATRAGFNRIDLALDAGVSAVASDGAETPAFRLWYLLVRPAPPN